MKPSDILQTHREAIRRVVEQNRARNPRIFGSVLHGDDTEDSDLDLLVDALPDTSLMDLARIQNELEQLLNVTVDVRTPGDLSERFRARVLAEAVPV